MLTFLKRTAALALVPLSLLTASAQAATVDYYVQGYFTFPGGGTPGGGTVPGSSTLSPVVPITDTRSITINNLQPGDLASPKGYSQVTVDGPGVVTGQTSTLRFDFNSNLAGFYAIPVGPPVLGVWSGTGEFGRFTVSTNGTNPNIDSFAGIGFTLKIIQLIPIVGGTPTGIAVATLSGTLSSSAPGGIPTSTLHVNFNSPNNIVTIGNTTYTLDNLVRVASAVPAVFTAVQGDIATTDTPDFANGSVPLPAVAPAGLLLLGGLAAKRKRKAATLA